MTAEPGSLLRNAVSEKDFQAQVVKLAKLNGFLCFHTFDSRRSEPGFPDLVLVRAGDEPIFAELKRENGRLTPAQKKWGAELLAAGADWRLWKPSSWPEIEETLTRRNR